MNKLWSIVVVSAVCAAVTACVGGDDDGGSDVPGDAGSTEAAGDAFEAVGDAADDFEAGQSGFDVNDGVSVEADPGTAVVEVDGKRIVYTMAGSIALTCDVSPDYVQVNVQTPDGQSMALVVSTLSGSWTGSLTATEADSNVAYGSSFAGGTVGIGETAVSYEGPIDKVVDRDIMNPESLTGTVAVNCASPGGDPAASIGGQEFVFPVSGAQSFQCTVDAAGFEIRVNRLALEGLQLQMQGTDDGSQWLGNVTVYTSDGNYSASLPPDGAGLVVDGGTVTFDGTFVGPDGSEVQGSATATCS